MIKFFEENWGWLLLMVITIFAITRIVKHLKVTPKPQNNQAEGNQKNNSESKPNTEDAKSNQQNNQKQTPPYPKEIFLRNMVIGIVIIVLALGLLMRMNTPYSEEKILQAGESYSFTSSWEDVQISPQHGCVDVIFPNQKQFFVCANTLIDIGNTGSGNHKITATENNQAIVISRIPSTLGKKFLFWINPKNWKFLFN